MQSPQHFGQNYSHSIEKLNKNWYQELSHFPFPQNLTDVKMITVFYKNVDRKVFVLTWGHDSWGHCSK